MNAHQEAARGDQVGAEVSRRGFLSRSAGWTAASSVLAGPAARRAVAARPRKEKIKIGQVGVGHSHAAGKMDAFRRSPDYEVVGLVESRPELQEEARQKVYHGIPRMSLEQLLNVPGLQAVAVETLVPDLLDVAETCVRAGLHIHLDKPPGDSMGQYRRILKLAAQKKRLVQMGYMYRYNPAILLLRDLLGKGWLGEPFEVHAVMSKVVSDASRDRVAAYAGGIMFELGCHLIDLVVGVLGKPREVSAFRQHTSPRNDRLWDNMLAVLVYPKALATVKSSANEVKGFARRHFVLCGSEGTCHIQPLDRPSVRLALSRQRGRYQAGYQEITLPPYQRYVADVADMARIIRGEKEPDFSYKHDLAAQETLLRACMLPVADGASPAPPP